MVIRPVKQRGIALLIVLLMLALVTVIAVDSAWQQKLSLRRAEHRFYMAQAQEFAFGGEQLVASILHGDALLDAKTDYPGDIWAKAEQMTYPLPGGEFSGSIRDEQGKINLNDLVEGKTINNQLSARLSRLFELLQIDPTLINSLTDWLDSDSEVTYPGGAEDSYYLNLERPYRAANQKLFSIDELRKIKGFDSQIFDKLKPHITALPEQTAININTATPLVLQSLSPHIEEYMTTEWIEQIKEAPFDSVDAFLKDGNNQNQNLKADLLDVKSQFFLAHIKVKIGNTQANRYTLFKRNEQNKLSIVRRATGN